MKFNTTSLITIFLIISIYTFIGGAAQANDETQSSIIGIKLGDNSAKVEKLLNRICPSINIINVEKVSFPLAKKSERHIVCKKLSIGGEIAITLADKEVVHVYSKGIPTSDISGILEEPRWEHSLGYKVYGIDAAELFVKEAKELVILVRHDGIHPNLFVWNNPYLEQIKVNEQLVSSKNGYPSILKFGSSFEELKSEFEANCDPLQIRETEPWLLNSPKKQIQVNCFNYNYLGFPRKIEAIFGDDILQLTWILSAKQEESRIRDLLVDTFGSSSHTNEDWEAFDDGRIYLRKDKPEVLAISDILLPYKEENF